MSFKYLTGPLMNMSAHGVPFGAGAVSGLPTPSVTADPSYPAANLYNGITALPFKCLAVNAGFYVSFSTNLVPNGDMEQGTTSWSATYGCTLQSITTSGYYLKGAKSLGVVASVAGGYASSGRITLQAGEYYQLWAATRAGAGSANVYVQCLDTARNVKTDGTWGVVSGGDVAIQSSATSMAARTPVTFRAPTYAELGRPTCEVLIHLGCTTATTSYFDEVFIVPGIDFIGVFGHGFPSETSFALAATTDYWHNPTGWSVMSPGGYAFNSAGGACKAQVAIHVNGARAYWPYPAVFFYPGNAYGTYTTPNIPWVGELVVGQTRSFARNPSALVVAPAYRGQQRSATRGGTLWVRNASDFAVREARLTMMATTFAQSEQLEDEFLGMSEGGRHQMILLPTELDAGGAILGRVTDTLSFNYGLKQGYSTTEVVVTEEPLPRIA